jgi:hypothetical protein
MLIAVVALLALGTPSPASAGILSQHALLTPQLRRGEVLTWFATITADMPWNHLCRNCGPDSHSDLLACSVTDQNQYGFLVTRRVRAFLADQPHTPILEHPAIIIGGGHEYKIDGSPLDDDPICLLYSSAMYGKPPKRLNIGTTWRFSRSPNFGYLKGLHGTATVTKLDPKSNSVSLHVSETGAGSALVDMTISDGGVIETESDRWDSHPKYLAVPKTIANPTDTIIWTRQHQSLVGLWRYPPSEVVPFPQYALPDVFNPNGRFISIWRVPFGPPITLIRIWHFGPFSVQSLIPALPRVRDVLLILGTIVLVLLVGKVATMFLVSDAGLAFVSPADRKRQVQVTGALALIAAACSMWWVYH